MTSLRSGFHTADERFDTLLKAPVEIAHNGCDYSVFTDRGMSNAHYDQIVVDVEHWALVRRSWVPIAEGFQPSTCITPAFKTTSLGAEHVARSC